MSDKFCTFLMRFLLWILIVRKPVFCRAIINNLHRNPEKSYVSTKYVSLKPHVEANIWQEERVSLIVSLFEYNIINLDFREFYLLWYTFENLLETFRSEFRLLNEIGVFWCKTLHRFCPKDVFFFLFPNSNSTFTIFHPFRQYLQIPAAFCICPYWRWTRL